MISIKFIFSLLSLQTLGALAFAPSIQSSICSSTSLDANSRRSFFENASAALIAPLLVVSGIGNPSMALAEDLEEEVRTVQTPLYSILRAREAMEQETRLIKSGRFKDVQRANVKLAVKFMVDNYRLNDNFIAAGAYLAGDRKNRAFDVGTNVVQNLYTILEYFDSSDVENIKVGALSMAGKEQLVLKGLDASRKGVDDFVSYFPKDDVLAVIAKIEAENELNMREFDKELNGGVGILNPKPPSP